MPKTTKNQTTSSEEKPKRGRPPKNVIGGRSSQKKGPGRPPKNVIQPRKSKEKTRVTMVTKTTKSIKKPIKKKVKKTTTKKATTNTEFTNHKVARQSKGSNFALWLLIFSFLLFVFSIYKAFFHNGLDTSLGEVPKLIEQLSNEIVVDETEVIMIDPYETNMANPEINTVISDVNTGRNTEAEAEIEKDTTINDVKTDNNLSQEKENNNTFQEKELFDLMSYTFQKSFQKGEQNGEVELLQKLLYNEGFYTGNISSIYDTTTVNSIHKFQIHYNIVDNKTPRSLRGYFGPSTRKKVNSLLPK